MCASGRDGNDFGTQTCRKLFFVNIPEPRYEARGVRTAAAAAINR